MKKIINTIFVLALLITIAPASAFAANVYLETAKNTISVGDTAIVTVKINAEGATINTVEGNISLKSPAVSLAVQEFSLANSSFGLWPRTPSLSVDGKMISFVGGVPGGFSIEGATVFKIIVEAKREGIVTITPEDISAYVNDGKGTKLPVKTTGLTIKVVPQQVGSIAYDEWNAILQNDTLPPEDFIIVLGVDPTLFEGKKFAFFSALDNQSGIDHYEVSEDGQPAVRSGSTYVLKNQTDNVRLDVVAIDKAGNKKSSSYSEQVGSDISWLRVVGIILLVVVIRYIYKKVRRNRTTNVPPQI